MNLTITIPCHNRPKYLKEVLASIERAGCNDTLAVLDNASDAVKEMVRASRWIDSIHECSLGITGANYRAYQIALLAGADLVLALEDDTPICADTIDLVRWFAGQSDYQFMNCFALTPEGTEQSARIKVVNTFCPWGWAFKREGYEKWIRPHWMENPKGWDITINELFQREKIPVLQPEMSRMRNIGREGGAHYTPEYYDSVFKGTMWSDGSKRDYRIV